MSTVLIPFIDHSSIDHKYYLREDYSDGSFRSICFRSGIYPNYQHNSIETCGTFFEKFLCYNHAMISLADYVFLSSCLNADLLDALIRDEAIKIYYNFGGKVSISRVSDLEPFSVGFHFDKTDDLEKYVRDYLRIHGLSFEESKIRRILHNLHNIKSLNVTSDWAMSLNHETMCDLQNKRIIDSLDLIDNGKILDPDKDHNQIMYNRIAYLNLYLSLGNKLNIRDVALPFELQSLLNAKIGAYLSPNNNAIHEGFRTIIEQSGIIDIPSLLSRKILSFEDVYKIRTSKKSVDFRTWLGQVVSGNDLVDILKMYNEANANGTLLNISREKNIVKTLKFVLPAIIGFVPIIGTIASNLIGTAMYISDMVNSNYKPRIFVDDFLSKYSE